MKTLSNAADKAEILSRLGRIQPNSQRRWGRMSAHGMICHLSDGFRLYMGDLPAKPAAVPMPRVLLTLVALWAPLPWPHGFRTMPEIDQEAAGTKPTEFSADVAELRRLIEAFTARPGRFSSTHPHFGPLTEKDWMRLGYLHVNHHLRQFGA